jgi:hypothetical protein
VFEGDRVRWHTVPVPNPGSGQTPTRRQVPQSTAFNGGEGIAYESGHIYFATKGDDRVWDLDVREDRIAVRYDRSTNALGVLRGVDNVAVTPQKDVLVAEDGGDMELVLVPPDGLALPLLRVEGQPFSELTGPAFDPHGQRLYFSSQRGRFGGGITYEVMGPFESLRRKSLA